MRKINQINSYIFCSNDIDIYPLVTVICAYDKKQGGITNETKLQCNRSKTQGACQSYC